MFLHYLRHLVCPGLQASNLGCLSLRSSQLAVHKELPLLHWGIHIPLKHDVCCSISPCTRQSREVRLCRHIMEFSMRPLSDLGPSCCPFHQPGPPTSTFPELILSPWESSIKPKDFSKWRHEKGKRETNSYISPLRGGLPLLSLWY